MLKRALIAFFLLGGVALGQSSAPPPPSEQHQNATEHPPTAKTEQKRPAKTWRENLSSIWDSTWDEPVVFYAFVLAVLTGVLALVSFVQGIFLFRADKTARISAEAANRSARAAIGIKLPIIRVKLDSLSLGKTSDGEDVSVYQAFIYNLGETKAFPVEILYGFTIGDVLPARAAYQFLAKFSINEIIEPKPNIETPTSIQLPMSAPLKSGDSQKISAGNYLWFFGHLRYRDFMDEMRTQGFCFRWAYVGSGVDWRVDETPAYNQKT